jgi:DNA-binding IclR family transcriptional regulator
VSFPQLAKACAKIKADGYAIDDTEYVEEVRCVAAPIRDKVGVVVASIGISAPLTRFS